MGKRRRPRARTAVGALIAALVASSTTIFAASYSAFTATASNASDAFSVGSVVLVDDDTGSSMFTTAAPGTGQVSAAGLKPGQFVQNCIRVTYSGSLPATVKMYATAISDVNGSGGTGTVSYLHTKIEEGTAGAFGCTGFAGATTIWDTTTHGGVASDLLGVFPITYATGPSSALASWTNTAFRVYRFTMTLDPATPDTSQGASATATFNWQAQNS
jgi:hypothetical protein